MENKVLGQVNRENAEEICSRIRTDAQAEVAIVIGRARAEAEKIIAQAQAQAAQKKQAVLKGLDEETQKLKDKIMSSLNLEKKRLVLSEKDKFVQAVIEAAQAEAAGFRSSPEYPLFLEKAILEGIAVIADSRIEVHYSALDERLVNEGFIKKIESGCAAAVKKQCALKFHKSDFQDLGVVVYSADGRMMFDNRFFARLARLKDEISMGLLKESF